MDSNPKFPKSNSLGINRRNFLRGALLAGAAPLLISACSPAPATTSANTTPSSSSSSGDVIKIGFIPLTDCASVVMADKLGLYEKHGVKVEVSKEASWANVRDKLLTGDLHAAHCLFG